MYIDSSNERQYDISTAMTSPQQQKKQKQKTKNKNKNKQTQYDSKQLFNYIEAEAYRSMNSGQVKVQKKNSFFIYKSYKVWI